MAAKHTAVLRISSEVFRQAFRFPDGTLITGICDNLDFMGTIRVRIEHDGLKEVTEGCEIPEIWPVYTQGEDGSITMVCDDWNFNSEPCKIVESKKPVGREFI